MSVVIAMILIFVACYAAMWLGDALDGLPDQATQQIFLSWLLLETVTIVGVIWIMS